MLSYPSRKYCITNCLFNFVLIPVKLRLIPVITMNCSPHAAILCYPIYKKEYVFTINLCKLCETKFDPSNQIYSQCNDNCKK